MKKLVTIYFIAFLIAGLFVPQQIKAQSPPQKMSYQAIIRDGSNALIALTSIEMRISILQLSGTAVYVETHSTTTNANGLVSIEIGTGITNDVFSAIPWASGPFYIKIETDPDGIVGGIIYSITGTSQLLSVPYALYAGTSGNGDSWLTVGNTLTTAGINFLGTTDPEPLMFKVNNVEAGYIDYDFNKANTGFGYQTLISNTTGHSNTANGYNALLNNTTGLHNTAIGKEALRANSEGNNNIALGSEALSYNTTGSFNVASGTSTMRFSTIGNYNTAVGTWALYDNTEGSSNAAYGTSALRSNITGNNNTAIGYGANVNSDNLSNTTALGNGAIATASNEVRIGNKDVSSLYFGTADNLAVTTDSVPNMFYDQATGQIMRSTAGGIGSGNYWELNGNSNTVDNGTFFIGTTNNIPFNIKVNNQKAGRIDHLKFNTFFGYQSGNANTTGKWNTAIGNIALRDNTTGHDNTAIGDETLTFNTTGNYVTALGEGALFRNTTGNDNAAVGYTALGSNTTGSQNTALGNYALFTNTTSPNNAAFGFKSLWKNTSGGNNTASGAFSLTANTSGGNNTSLGFQAMQANIIGSQNTAVGSGALLVSNGNFNTATGANSLYANTTGFNNSAFGTAALQFNVSGNYNTAVGRGALVSNHLGNNNTAIGYGANVNSDNLSNTTALGNGAIATANNQIRLGNANVSSLYFGTANNLAVTTDSIPNMYYDDATGQIMRSTVLANNSANGWHISGNGSPISDANFIGTTTDIPFNIRVFDEKAGRIDNKFANTFYGFQSGNSWTSGLYNTANGQTALFSNTTGFSNTAIGYKSLYSTLTSTGNTALGFNAGDNNINNGGYNTFIGYNAYAHADGFINTTALGYEAKTTASNEVRIGNARVNALYFGTANNLAITTDSIPNMYYDYATGQIMRSTAGGIGSGNHWDILGNSSTIDYVNYVGTKDNVALNFRVHDINAGRIDPDLYNTFFGIQTGDAVPTGKWNTAFGNIALRDNTTGQDNTAIGDEALTTNISGKSNTANGKRALFSNTIGNYNTANGFEALYNNTSGSYNTASGIQSLYTNTSGDNNTAYGFASLNFNTTGNYNTAIGQQTLYQNSTGSQNTALGLSALYANTTGSNNTAIGISALLNTTASGNTALGDNAGNNSINNGNNNTFLGYNAFADADGYTNATALGFNAIVGGSDKMILGNNDVNVGIGLSGISGGPQNKLEINAYNPDESGLRFRRLTSASTPTTNPGVVLSVDASGDVILVPDATGTGSSIHFIGESYGGGTVFYIYDGGLHGLIAATSDQSTGVQWYNTVYRFTGTTGDGILAGKMNTALIVATQMADDQTGIFAAKVCVDHAQTTTTLGDWYLPSITELRWLNKEKITVGGFFNNDYWSSTESDANNTWLLNFTTTSGTPSIATKNISALVRAIRSF